MGGLGLGMGSSRSTSEASFSTALSTNFSVSGLFDLSLSLLLSFLEADYLP